MNKFFIFTGIILILFFVFACTIPSEVEIKGSPSLEFIINMNLNDYFSDMIEAALTADGETKIIPCTNSSLEAKVFLLQMNVFSEEDYKCDDMGFNKPGHITINGVDIPVNDIGGGKIKVDKETDIAESEEPYVLTFEGLADSDYLKGFEFKGIKSKLYIYGTDLAKSLKIKIKKNNTYIPESDDEELRELSVVDSLEEYPGTALPTGGRDIDISDVVNKGGELSFEYEIYIEAGTEIDSGLFKDPHSIYAEIVIWFPIELESIEKDAAFKFSDFFDELGDVIKSLAESNYIENMSVKMAMTPLNPFGNGIFIIEDEGYGNIKNPLDDHSFLINLNEEEIDYINKNPFDPSFFILYPDKGSKLEIPNGDIVITTISLDVKFDYTMGLLK